jgi:hypothetical protein
LDLKQGDLPPVTGDLAVLISSRDAILQRLAGPYDKMEKMSNGKSCYRKQGDKIFLHWRPGTRGKASKWRFDSSTDADDGFAWVESDSDSPPAQGWQAIVSIFRGPKALPMSVMVKATCTTQVRTLVAAQSSCFAGCFAAILDMSPPDVKAKARHVYDSMGLDDQVRDATEVVKGKYELVRRKTQDLTESAKQLQASAKQLHEEYRPVVQAKLDEASKAYIKTHDMYYPTVKEKIQKLGIGSSSNGAVKGGRAASKAKEVVSGVPVVLSAVVEETQPAEAVPCGTKLEADSAKKVQRLNLKDMSIESREKYVASLRSWKIHQSQLDDLKTTKTKASESPKRKGAAALLKGLRSGEVSKIVDTMENEVTGAADAAPVSPRLPGSPREAAEAAEAAQRVAEAAREAAEAAQREAAEAAQLEAAEAARIREYPTTWKYLPCNDAPCAIQTGPRVGSLLSMHEVAPGEVFQVSEERFDDESDVTFLKLADGRGWLFDTKPGVGQVCARVDDTA